MSARVCVCACAGELLRAGVYAQANATAGTEVPEQPKTDAHQHSWLSRGIHTHTDTHTDTDTHTHTKAKTNNKD